MLKSKHLIGLEHFPVSDLNKIIDTSFKFKDILQTESRKAILLKGKTIVNMFFENSTRTKISFSLAEKRLGADSINFSASTSSVKKGETLKDTVQNILGGLRSSCTYVGAPSLKQLSKCTTFVRVKQQYNDTFE